MKRRIEAKRARPRAGRPIDHISLAPGPYTFLKLDFHPGTAQFRGQPDFIIAYTVPPTAPWKSKLKFVVLVIQYMWPHMMFRQFRLSAFYFLRTKYRIKIPVVILKALKIV